MIPTFNIGDLVSIKLNDNQYKVGRINLLFFDIDKKIIKYKLEDDSRLYEENDLIGYKYFIKQIGGIDFA